jgi:hypothetical protein
MALKYYREKNEHIKWGTKFKNELKHLEFLIFFNNQKKASMNLEKVMSNCFSSHNILYKVIFVR